MVDFDLGYDAEAPASVETINSCVYMLPEPDRDGYTFEGWWVSAYDDAEKLTYRFENGMQLTEDTTLYAVWSDKAAEATAPLVSVDANNVRWTRPAASSIRKNYNWWNCRAPPSYARDCHPRNRW